MTNVFLANLQRVLFANVVESKNRGRYRTKIINRKAGCPLECQAFPLPSKYRSYPSIFPIAWPMYIPRQGSGQYHRPSQSSRYRSTDYVAELALSNSLNCTAQRISSRHLGMTADEIAQDKNNPSHVWVELGCASCQATTLPTI